MPTVALPLDARVAACAFAVDPAGVGGVRLRGAAGGGRDAWVAALRARLPPRTPWKRVPPGIDDERLLGGIDLAATLAAGRPVARPGLLVEAAGGLLVLAMAERCTPAVAGRVAAAIDAASQDGFGVLAFDEALPDDPVLAPVLADRLGIDVELDRRATPTAPAPAPAPFDVDTADVAAARARLPDVRAGDDVVHALCDAARALGIASLRAPLLALRVARIVAALGGRREVEAADAAWAARLVLGPRARTSPTPSPPSPPSPPAPQADAPGAADTGDPAPGPAPSSTGRTAPPGTDADSGTGQPDLEERLVDAAKASLPAGLLARLAADAGASSGASGRADATRHTSTHGRPVGTRPGSPRDGGRLDLLQTLRAAAPWQALRRREGAQGAARRTVIVRAADFRVRRCVQHCQGTTIFAVDASGSQALSRLAEAKGAVELLLVDCYVRRDRVAVIAFRERAAQLLLPPTRSLVRARRSLAELPGGGGTPLASGIDAARTLALSVRRGGGVPLLVLLTDGSANIARDGSPGRPAAHADALASSAAWRATALGALLIDTAARRQPATRQLAQAMGARHVALPDADAGALARAVSRAVSPGGLPPHRRAPGK